MTDDVAGDGRAPDDLTSSHEERERQAAAHLQRATLEMIDALRAVLDVAEEAVLEPGGVMAVVTETLGGVAEVVASLAPGWAERGRRAAARTGAGHNSAAGGAGAEADGAEEDGVQEDGGQEAGGQAHGRRTQPGDGDRGEPGPTVSGAQARPPRGGRLPDRPGLQHIRIS